MGIWWNTQWVLLGARLLELQCSGGSQPIKMKMFQYQTLCKKATIHQVTTMLVTSKHVLFLGHNHLLTIGTDVPTLWLSPVCQVWPGKRTFLEVASMVVSWWIEAFLRSERTLVLSTELLGNEEHWIYYTFLKIQQESYQSIIMFQYYFNISGVLLHY